MACTPRLRRFRPLRGEVRGTRRRDCVGAARAREGEPSRLFCCAERRALARRHTLAESRSVASRPEPRGGIGGAYHELALAP
jgi:hypothetical protein